MTLAERWSELDANTKSALINKWVYRPGVSECQRVPRSIPRTTELWYNMLSSFMHIPEGSVISLIYGKECIKGTVMNILLFQRSHKAEFMHVRTKDTKEATVDHIYLSGIDQVLNIRGKFAQNSYFSVPSPCWLLTYKIENPDEECQVCEIDYSDMDGLNRKMTILIT